MAKEYIDREEVLSGYFWAGWGIGNAVQCERIKLISAADVAPVVHGKWVLNRNPYGQDTFQCSICKKSVAIMSYYFPHKYCPNCGAKMDLEVDDG